MVTRNTKRVGDGSVPAGYFPGLNLATLDTGGTVPASQLDLSDYATLSADGSTEQAGLRERYPEQHGAVGDGVTDDSAAIQAAAIFLVEQGGGDLVFSGQYYIGDTTITIPISVSTQARRVAKIVYDGDSVALDIYGNNAFGGRVMVVPMIVKKGQEGSGGPIWDTGADTTSVGVRVTGCHHDTIHFSEIRNFRYGLVLRAVAATGDNASSGNVIYNTFTFGRIINCWRAVEAEWYDGAGGSDPDAGINQNRFSGGAFRIDSAWNHEASRLAINLPDAENNLNVFDTISLEGQWEQGVFCNSIENVFIDVRIEGHTTDPDFIEFGSGGINNIWIGGTTTALSPRWTCVTDNGYGNLFIWADSIECKFWRLDRNTGKMLFGGGTAAPAVPILGVGTVQLQIGDSNTQGTRRYGNEFEVVSPQTTGSQLPRRQNNHILNFGSATNINGMESQSTDKAGLVTVMSLTGNETLKHNGTSATKFIMQAAADKTLTAFVPVRFFLYNSTLYEV